MNVNQITSSRMYFNDAISHKNKNIPQNVVNTTTLPSFADAKSLVNINFKAEIHDLAYEHKWDEVLAKLAEGDATNDPDDLPSHLVNLQDDNGNTILHIAATTRDAEGVRKILTRPDVDLSVINIWLRTPLYYPGRFMCALKPDTDAYKASAEIEDMLVAYQPTNEKIAAEIEKNPPEKSTLAGLFAIGYTIVNGVVKRFVKGQVSNRLRP